MNAYARIIAQLTDGSWSAWFEDAAADVCDDNEDWASAVARLIDIYGSPDLEWGLISEIEEARAWNHIEFLIPYSANCQLSLSISVN